MVEVPRWLEIPMKSMLGDLAIDFGEVEAQGDWIKLAVEGVQKKLGHPGGGLGYWWDFFADFPQAPDPLALAGAYWHGLAYARALDRWKRKQDSLANPLKIAPVVAYLDGHLKGTILQAKNPYQLSEAVGLNLAKLELVEKWPAPQAKPVVAVGGALAYLDSLPFQRLLVQGLGETVGYYLCYDYSSLMAKGGKFRGYLNLFRGQKHRYYYNEDYCFDLHSRNYQVMVCVYDEGGGLKKEILEKLQKRRPILFYRIRDIEARPEEFVHWLRDRVAEFDLEGGN